MAQMANRIAVQPPYFAFKSLYTLPDEWDIYGEFTPEQPQGNELGPLATAEAGRHLAILGSCAAARTQFEAARVYYLASHAQWNLRYRPVRLGQTPWMTARAKIVEQSRKIICAETQLLVDGQPFADLFVSYHVLAEKTFDKLFARHRSPAPLPSGHSPYAEAFPLSVLELSDREITACSVGFQRRTVRRTFSAIRHVAGRRCDVRDESGHVPATGSQNAASRFLQAFACDVRRSRTGAGRQAIAVQCSPCFHG